MGCIQSICVDQAKDKMARFRCDWNVLRHLQQQYKDGHIMAVLEQLQSAVQKQLVKPMRHSDRNDVRSNPFSKCKGRFLYGFQVELVHDPAWAVAAAAALQGGNDAVDTSTADRYSFSVRAIKRGSRSVNDPLLQTWTQQFRQSAEPDDHIDISSEVYYVMDCSTKRRVDMVGDRVPPPGTVAIPTDEVSILSLGQSAQAVVDLRVCCQGSHVGVTCPCSAELFLGPGRSLHLPRDCRLW